MKQHGWPMVAIGAAAVTALTAGGLGQAPGDASAAAARQDTAHGGTLYVEYGCYQCHGRAGQGAPLSGPRLVPSQGSYATFARQVWEPRDQMPPYSREFVSEEDVADIYAYLQALPPSPALEDVPLLNQ